MRTVVGSATDVGRRRTGNEDSFLVDADKQLFAVADGVGGHNAGEVASATAIEALRATFRDASEIGDAVRNANNAVIDKAATDADYDNMGTTLTALAVDDHSATIGHVGDSRAYLLRDGELTRITEDHKWVEQLVREGRISPEEAEVHPQRNIVTRALGFDRDVEVDTEAVDLTPGDRLLLCSDGLSDMVREPEIAALLRREPQPQRAAQMLVDAANAAGGDDNITVVVVDVEGDAHADAIAASEAIANAELPQDATGAFEAPPDLGGPPRVHEQVAEAERQARQRQRHRRMVRIVAVVLPMMLLIGAGVGALGWYARRNFFVGSDHGKLTLFRGVPGGVLGWDPTVEKHYDVTVADLEPADRADVRRGHKFTSRHDAVQFVQKMQAEIVLLQAQGTLPSSTTSTTGATPPANTVPST